MREEQEFRGHVIKNVICSLGKTKPLSMDYDKWALYERQVLIANSGRIGRYGGRCLEAASQLISRVLDSSGLVICESWDSTRFLTVLRRCAIGYLY